MRTRSSPWTAPGGTKQATGYACQNNITLLHLPPYSPELNPVENVWAYLRSNTLSNRIYESYDAIVDACCNAWNWFANQPERITTIGTRDWAQVS